MLEIESLTTGYGRLDVVSDLSLSVTGEKRIVIMGANGAGKTTLCKCVSGIIPAKSGNIRFMGEDVTRMSPEARVRRGIVQVPEGRQIFPRMTVLENLKLGAYLYGAPTQEEFGGVFALFPILEERAQQLGGLLSGGEQQMLAIARAILTRPRLLMLDEPSQGLAPIAVRQVADAVNRIAESGVAILLVEQNLSLARASGEYAYVLAEGHVEISGDVDAVLSEEAVIASYLGGAARTHASTE